MRRTLLPGTLLPLLLCLACARAALAPEDVLRGAADDECHGPDLDGSGCALSLLQRRGSGTGVASAQWRPPAAPAGAPASIARRPGNATNALFEQRVTGEAAGASSAEFIAGTDKLAALLSNEAHGGGALTDRLSEAELEVLMSASKLSPINLFNDQLDSFTAQGSGVYYEFRTGLGELVFDGQAEGRFGQYADATTPFPLASASKLLTAFAAMCTMQLRPKDWYPSKYVDRFRGWEQFKDFPVHGSNKKARLKIHHLLTHTSGLPFGMRMSKEDLRGQTLFFSPGTQFGYTLGHRVIGWLLRDYWMWQPEGRKARIRNVQDTFEWLFFRKLGLSPSTRFSTEMTQLFGYEGMAGDASIQSTGEDLMKLAVVALRRGRLPGGRWLISERNWNRWAVPNLLPGGKLSQDLVGWKGAAGSWLNWNVGGLKEKIMKQHGEYGWNYFGATYNRSKEVGWCGFFSSCLRVTYANDLAFVMMQRDVADLKKSKPFVVRYFGRMAKSLQCTKKHCARPTGRSLFCETDIRDLTWTGRCPFNTTRGKWWHRDTQLDEHHFTCYVPRCHR